jgi:hypothetical protein
MKLKFFLGRVNNGFVKPTAELTGITVGSAAIGYGINAGVETVTDFAKKTYNDYLPERPTPNK